MKVSTGETNPSSALKPALSAALAALLLSTALAPTVRASDHFDSPATAANPQADIGDVYAWTSPKVAS